MEMLKHRVKELEAKIRRHQRLYDAGMAELSDAAFDELTAELSRVAPTSPVLNELGLATTTNVVQHFSPMLSLGKVYEDYELREWVTNLSLDQGNTFDLIVQPKYDGVAVSLRYIGGKLVSAATRGNGEAGDDITPGILAASRPSRGGQQCLNIPLSACVGDAAGAGVEVRGELLMPIKTFESKYAQDYANPRNMIVGMAMRGDADGLRDACFVAYDYALISGADTTELEIKLNELSNAGFFTGSYRVVVRSGDQHDFMGSIRDFAKAASDVFSSSQWSTPFETDGVVYKVNQPEPRARLGATAHHPRWAVAWKYQGETGTTELLDVVWETSRAGTITPVAVMAPIKLSGVVITRATLHNAMRFHELNLFRGDDLVVTRRGGVIPHVEEARRVPNRSGEQFDTPDVCPACGAPAYGGPYSMTTLACSRKDRCIAVQRGKIVHWCQETGMLGIGPEFAERLVSSGQITTVVDLYRLDERKLLLAGFGEGQTANILAEINKTRTLDPTTFLTALGIERLGRTTAKKVLPLLDWETLEIRPSRLHGRPSRLRDIQQALQDSQDLIDALLVYVRLEHTKQTSSAQGSPFSGKRVVFTGALADMDRNVAQELVRQYGGDTPASLTRETDILVIGEYAKESQTSKRDKADKYNQKGARIEIIDEAEFARRIADAMSTTLTVD